MEKPTKITFGLILGSILSAILHNLVYGLFGSEEAFFFLLCLGLFLGFLVAVVYNVFTYRTRGKPKDLWRLGWLGVLGLIGALPGFKKVFSAFYAFFGFYGLKRK